MHLCSNCDLLHEIRCGVFYFWHHVLPLKKFWILEHFIFWITDIQLGLQTKTCACMNICTCLFKVDAYLCEFFIYEYVVMTSDQQPLLIFSCFYKHYGIICIIVVNQKILLEQVDKLKRQIFNWDTVDMVSLWICKARIPGLCCWGNVLW